VLLTGLPGTAKTTLSGAFTAAACRRGERTVFVSFDSDGAEVIRNLKSVGINLQRHVDSGCLRMISARTITGSAETLLVQIKMLAKEHGARCLVIDPVSALAKTGNELTARGVAERLIDWAKHESITLVCTSLLDDVNNQTNGGTPLQISTLADTWIHLNYLMQSGERNRGMSIIKSRGTSHSNQVRELILSSSGVTLADIYAAGGDVLMGTLRWERENAEKLALGVAKEESHLERLRLNAEKVELEARIKRLQAELDAKLIEKTLLENSNERRAKQQQQRHNRVRELRRADAHAGTERMNTNPRSRFKFRLYTSNTTQNSAQALSNITSICQTYLANHYEIEVLDVFSNPERAIADGIRMTPTLLKLAPRPPQRIIGTLARTERVLLALGLESLKTV
jgi:circadian clock protein KaiC